MYVPQGIFATKQRMRLLLANLPRVHELLGVDTDAEAIERIHTYGEEVTADKAPVLQYPTIMIQEFEVHANTGDAGEIIDIPQRTLECWFAFYVPDDIDGIDSITDEEAWVDEQFSNILYECLERTGQSESVTGETHLHVMNPVYHGSQRQPNDEPGDTRLDPHPELAKWYGLLMWEVH